MMISPAASASAATAAFSWNVQLPRLDKMIEWRGRLPSSGAHPSEGDAKSTWLDAVPAKGCLRPYGAARPKRQQCVSG